MKCISLLTSAFCWTLMNNKCCCACWMCFVLEFRCTGNTLLHTNAPSARKMNLPFQYQFHIWRPIWYRFLWPHVLPELKIIIKQDIHILIMLVAHRLKSGNACYHSVQNLFSSSWLSKSTKINHLTPNGHYMGRTAQLTSRRYILYIYSTNIRTEYFKHAA